MIPARRNTWLLAMMAAVLLFPVSAPAQDGGQYKIGVVNIRDVFEQYDKQKVEYAKLEKEKDALQVKITALSDEIEKAKEQYDKQKDTMSKEQLDALEEKVQSDYTEYQAEFGKFQSEIDRKEKKLLEDLFANIRSAVQEVGNQGNYHLILEGGESGRTGVLYSSSTLNVTPQVIEYVNAQYKKR